MKHQTGSADMLTKASARSRRRSISLVLALTFGLVAEANGQVLDDFVNQLLALESVHVEARAVLLLTMDGATRGGSGSVSYWEEGDWYRLSSSTNDSLKLLGNLEYSFDGDHSRIWLKSENTIVKNTSANESAPSAIPNPFFLAAGFLIGEGCEGCRVSLDLVRQARSQMSESVDEFGQLSVENTQFGRDFRVDVVTIEDMDVPSRISWVDATFDADVEILLEDYSLTNGLIWPTSITMESTGRSSDFSSSIRYLIKTFEVNEVYPKEVFTLSGDENTTFFDAPKKP